MTKKNFIALANVIRNANSIISETDNRPIEHFTPYAIECLANFCASQNPNFMRDRWLDYIAGKCGPNGGAVK